MSYQWNWGDGSGLTTTVTPLSNHVFSAPATYVVVLTVTDDQGQTGVVTGPVTVSAVGP